MLSIPCGEADKPTCVEGGQLLRRIIHGTRIGPIKELNIFNKKRNVGIDLKVPSTSDPELLIWVNSCTDDVQNCRRIAAVNTVILRENQNNEISEGSGEVVTQGVTLIAKGGPEHEHLPIQGGVGLSFHAQEIFQVRRSQVYPKRQLGWQGENTSGLFKSTVRA